MPTLSDVETAVESVVERVTHYRVKHSGEVLPALASPAGYEAAHPEEFEPLTPEEVQVHLSGNQIIDPPISAPVTPPLPSAPPLLAAPMVIALPPDDSAASAATNDGAPPPPDLDAGLPPGPPPAAT